MESTMNKETNNQFIILKLIWNFGHLIKPCTVSSKIEEGLGLH